MGLGPGSPAPPRPPSPSLPRGGRGRAQGARGSLLTFPNGAIWRRGVVGEEEAGSVPAVAAPAPGGYGALVFWGHGWLVDGRAVLMGKRSCRWVPIGARICIARVRDTKLRVRHGNSRWGAVSKVRVLCPGVWK